MEPGATGQCAGAAVCRYSAAARCHRRLCHHIQPALAELVSRKLGLGNYEEAVDRPLVDELFKALTCVETDMTIFFRRLERLTPGGLPMSDQELLEPLSDAFYVAEQLTELGVEH